MALASSRIPPLLRHSETLALALLVLAVAGAHALWIARNAAPMPHPQDPYYYLARTLEFADALRAGSAAGVREAFEGLATAGRSPLYQLLATPFVLVLGRSIEAALLINALWWIALLLAANGLGQLLAGRRAGLLAAVVTAAFPPLVHLSHVYRPHFALAACVAVSLWLLLRLLERPSVAAAWAAGVSLSVALAMHPTAAWSLGFPAAAIGLHLVFFRSPPRLPAGPHAAPRWLVAKLADPLLWRGLAPAAFVAVAPTLAWYASFGAPLLERAGDLAEEQVVVLGFPGVEPSLSWYLRTAPGALSNVLAAFGALAVLAALLRRQLASQLLAWSVVVGLAVLSLTWLRVWWYAAPLLAPLAALVGAFVLRLRPVALARAVGAGCVAVSFLVFVFVLYAPASWSGLARALGAPLDSPSCDNLRPALFCPGRAYPEPWPVPEILRQVQADDPRCASGERRCRMFLVGPDRFAPGAMLGRGLLSYEWVRGWPGARVEVLGIHRGNCGLPAFPDSDYLLTLEPAPGPRSPCYEAWGALLREPPPFFSRNWRGLGSFRLPDGRIATLQRREGDWTPAGRARIERALLARLPAPLPDAGAPLR